MQLITITGGRTLHGRIRPAAAKNSVLPLLAATLLCRTPSRLRAVPPLADVATSLALLQSVGAKAERQGSDLFVAPGQDLQGEIPDYLAGAMRSSVFYLAPLLCRVGYELILLRIMQVKATREINRKLSFLVPEGAAQAVEEEDLREEPEKEAPTTAKTPTEPPRAHCPSCGTWYQEALGKCPVCGRAHEKDES